VDASVGATINATINGVIAWSGFKGSAAVPLSMDSIDSPGVTALGNPASMAFALVSPRPSRSGAPGRKC